VAENLLPENATFLSASRLANIHLQVTTLNRAQRLAIYLWIEDAFQTSFSCDRTLYYVKTAPHRSAELYWLLPEGADSPSRDPFVSIFLDHYHRYRAPPYDFTGKMSVVYEPRNFIHDGAYPPDPTGDPNDRYADADESDLGPFNPPPPMLGDDRSMLSDDRGLLVDASATVPDGSSLDISVGVPKSLTAELQEAVDGLHDVLHNHASADKASPEVPTPSPEATTPSSRVKPIPKPDRDVAKNADGKYYCNFQGCTEDNQVFSRKCEWR
jgi:hypothetical protein